jgi:hypothetical protein
VPRGAAAEITLSGDPLSPAVFDITPWAARVQVIDAIYIGTWELPVLGAVTAPTAVLIRRDGHVAGWETDPTWSSLTRSAPGSDRPLRPSEERSAIWAGHWEMTPEFARRNTADDLAIAELRQATTPPG